MRLAGAVQGSVEGLEATLQQEPATGCREVPGGPLRGSGTNVRINPCGTGNPEQRQAHNSCCAAPSAPPRLRLRPSERHRVATSYGITAPASQCPDGMRSETGTAFPLRARTWCHSFVGHHGAALQQRFPPGATHLKTRWKAKSPQPAQSSSTPTPPSTSGNRKRWGLKHVVEATFR